MHRKHYKINTREYYNINAKEFSDSTLISDMRELYLQFEKYLKPGCKILDLGCGSGRDSIYFINNGYEVISCDYSEELARLASINIGKDVIIGDMREIDFEYSFDAIWASASRSFSLRPTPQYSDLVIYTQRANNHK